MSNLISDYAQVVISNKVKDIVRMYTVVVGTQSSTIGTRTLLNGDIQQLRLGLTPSLTDLGHLHTAAGCFA